MPYIKEKRRRKLDPILQELWDTVSVKPTEKRGLVGMEEKTLDEMKGDVNYCFTKILVTMLAKFRTRYHVLSNIKAIPKDVADEFKRQFMHPYEDEKKLESGEVTPLRIQESGDVG